MSREVRHRDAILLLPTHVRVRLVRPGFGRISYMVPRSCTFEELRKRVAADVGETFEAFPAGGDRHNLFGPGKRLADVVRPNCFFVQQAWTGVVDASDIIDAAPPKKTFLEYVSRD